METDEALLAAWRAGDRRAGNELFRRHYETIRRFFINKVDSDLEDLIQRTFEVCLRNRDNFEGRSSFLAYLRGIARNLLLKHWDAAAIRGRIEDLEAVSLADLGAGPSSVLARSQEEKRALDALRLIKLADQELLEFYYLGQHTAPQLAQMYGVPENTVRSRLRRARDAWREKYEELSRRAGVPSDARHSLEDWAHAWQAKLSLATEAID